MKPKLTRVAVAQIDYHIAGVLARRALIEGPLGRLGDAGLAAPSDAPPWLCEAVAELRGEVRRAYVENLEGKVTAIVRACQAWGVELLVFPEYSIPAELLPGLAKQFGEMTIVAGSHSIERRNLEIYAGLGLEDLDGCRPGMAVAPILHRGRLVRLQPKLSAAPIEQGSLQPGEHWAPIDVDGIGRLGVLLCLDFLHRERAVHREEVGPQLESTRLLVVPSVTSWHTADDFDARSREESQRYGRPVLYANIANRGGSTVYVDHGNPGLRFPEVPGVLGPNEEGVVVVDVDLGTHAIGGSASFDSSPIMRPIAAASLLYGYNEIMARYGILAERWARETRGEDWSLDSMLTDVAENEPLLREVMGLAPSSARSDRLGRLLVDRERICGHEELRAFLREIPLPTHVLPNQAHGFALAHGCHERLFAIAVRNGMSLPSQLEDLGAESPQSRVAPDWTEAARAQLALLSQRFAGDRANVDRFPIDAPIANYRRQVGPFEFVFRSSPDLLMTLGSRSLKLGMIFFGSGPGDGNRVRTGDWPLTETNATRDLWLAARAQGWLEATIVGVLDAEPVSYAPDIPETGQFRELSARGGLLVTYAHEGRRRLVAATWTEGGAWLQARQAALCEALSILCAGVQEIEFLTPEQHEHQIRALLPRFLGARAQVRQTLQRKLDEVEQQFVEPRVSCGEETRPAFDVLSEWLDTDTKIGLLFGSFGSGKSTLLAAWANEQWENAGGPLVGSAPPLPVFVDLAGVRGASPNQLIAIACDRDPEDKGDLCALGLLIEHGLILPIFDGIDELATGMTERDLWGAVAALATVGGLNGKVLLSLRNHVFRDEAHRQQIVHAALDHARAGKGLSMTLEPLTDDQIDDLLERVLAVEERAEVRKRISEVYDLKDLAKTPLLLSMIIATRAKLAGATAVSSARLYSAYLERWLDQAEVGGPELFSQAEKREFGERLAFELWKSGCPSCSWMDLRKSAQALQYESRARDELSDAAFLELQGASFFVHEEGERFRFAHKSFLEYFMARVVIRGLRADPSACLAVDRLTPEVSKFVLELAEECSVDPLQRLRRWLGRGKGTEPRAVANALRLLRDVARLTGHANDWIPAGIDLRSIDLRGDELRDLDLRGADFEGADLRGVDFTGAVLDGCSFRGADLGGAKLRSTTARAANFEAALLTGVDAHDVDLDGAMFDGADLRRSTWTSCTWGGARVDELQLRLMFAPGLGGELPEVMPRLVKPYYSSCTDLAWSPDGRRLATATEDGAVQVWNAESAELEAVFGARSCRSLSWLADGPVLVYGTSRGETFIFDVDAGITRGSLPQLGAAVIRLVPSPDGEFIARLDQDGGVHLFGCETSEDRHLQLDGPANDLEWSSDSQMLAVATSGHVQVVSVADGSIRFALTELAAGPKYVCWGASGDELIVGVGATLRRYSLDDDACIREVEGDQPILGLAACSVKQLYAVWRAKAYELRDGYDDSAGTTQAEAAVVTMRNSSRGEWALRGPRGHVWIWTGFGMRVLWVGPLRGGCRVGWSRDGQDIVIVTDDQNNGRVWSVDELKPARDMTSADRAPSRLQQPADCPIVVVGSTPTVVRVEVPSPNGRLLALGNGSVLELREVANDALIHCFDAGAKIQGAAWSPDERQLAIWDHEHGVRCWYAGEGEARLVLRRDFEPVIDVAWSPSGDRLACVCADGALSVVPVGGGEVVHLEQDQSDRQCTLIVSGSGSFWLDSPDVKRCRLTIDHAEEQARWFLPMAGHSQSETDETALLAALTGRSR